MYKKNCLDFHYRYDPAFEQFCIKLCYLNVLRYYNEPFAMLYINSVPVFKVEWHEGIPAFSYYMEPLIASQTHKAITCGRCGNQINEIVQYIDREYPCLAVVDGYYLSYHPSYQKQHEEHMAIIYGYDWDGHTILVADNMPPYFFDGAIEISRLKPAIKVWGILNKTRCEIDARTMILETAVHTRRFLYESHVKGYAAFLIFSDWILSFQVLDEKKYIYFHKQMGSMSSYLNLLLLYMLEACKMEPAVNALCCFLKSWLLKWKNLKINLLKSLYSGKWNDEYKLLLSMVLSDWGELKKQLDNLVTIL